MLYRSDSPDEFGLLLTPDHSLPAITGISEALRIANDVAGCELFRWHTVAAQREPLRSASGLALMPDRAIDDSLDYSHVVICSSYGSHDYADPRVLRWLRRLDLRGCVLGGATSGSWLLARAGLLDGYRCTLHWQEVEAFRERYPQLDVSTQLYVIDRRRFSCASGLAAVDMVITLIARRHGQVLGRAVRERLVHDRWRAADEQQLGPAQRYPGSPPSLHRALALMAEQVESPLALAQIAEGSGISPRQLSRLCQRYLGCTAQQHYLQLRLEQAAVLLDQSGRSVTEVALACGFADLSHFCAAFKRRYAHTPTAYAARRTSG